MRQVTKSVLVPYTSAQMYELVHDVEKYSEFVPWISEATVLERGADYLVGRLTMQRGGIKETFTTRNTFARPDEIRLDLVEGPFKALVGLWAFEGLGQRGSKVTLNVRFELSNPMLSLLLSRTVEKSYAELVDAFVARARMVYGKQ